MNQSQILDTAVFPAVFKELLESLERASVRYRLLRPGCDAPEECSELDILVWPQARREFHRVVTDQGFLRLRQSPTCKAVYGRVGDGVIYVLDVHFAFIQRGLKYHRLAVVEDRSARTPDGFATLTPEDLLLHLYFHNFVGKSGLQEKHLAEVRGVLEGDIDKDYLRAQFPSAEDWGLFESFCASPKFFLRGSPAAQETAAKVTQQLLRGSWTNRWRRFRMRALKWFRRRRRGVQVVFLGVDGCGKSTSVAAVKEMLTARDLQSKEVYMGPWGRLKSWPLKLVHRLRIYPSKERWGQKLRARFAGKSADVGILTATKKLCSAGIKGVVYYAAVYYELWHRYLTQVRPALRKGRVVLSDRYIYDLRYIYKLRRMDGHSWLRSCVCRLFPRPDLVVFLHNDPKTIASRKDQLTPAQIEEFQQLYRRAMTSCKVLEVKTDQAPDRLADTIVRRIIQIYFERNVAK